MWKSLQALKMKLNFWINHGQIQSLFDIILSLISTSKKKTPEEVHTIYSLSKSSPTALLTPLAPLDKLVNLLQLI